MNQNIDESLNKIKFLMNYDSTKTLIENRDTISLNEQTVPGELALKTAKGAGLAGLGGYLAGPAVAGYTGAAISTGAAATVGATLAGAAALGLVPLVLWLNDKDKMYPKVVKIFKYVEDNKEKIDKIPRGMSDEEIWDAADILYSAMKRLGTREKDVYKVFESLQTISDFAALIDRYNQDNTIHLLKQLNRDFDQTKEWMRIYRPIRNLVLRFAKQAELMGKEQKSDKSSKITPPESNTHIAPPVNAPVPVMSGYKPVKGTIDDPYVRGTSGDGVSIVQRCLGLIQDGKFGPKTEAALAKIDGSYSKSFTHSDIADICLKSQNIVKPEIGHLKTPTLAQSPDKSNLIPMKPSTVTKADALKKYRLVKKEDNLAKKEVEK